MPAIALRRHTPLILQIDKMRKNRATSRADQARVQAFIHYGHHIGDMPLTALQQGHDLPFALAAMTDHTTHKLARVIYRRTMSRIINTVVALV